MKPEAIIILRPDVDFPTFLGLSSRILGRSPGAPADASGKRLSDAERFLSCLMSMRDGNLPEEFSPKLFPHVSFGLLVVADERDMRDVLECAAGMPFVLADTAVRGVLVSVITGTLAQWKSAVAAGSGSDEETTVRMVFNRIHGLFKEEGLNLWVDFCQRPAQDQITFLLEDKRTH